MIRSALCFLLLVLRLPALAQHAHEHGVARLDIAVEQGGVTIALESPLDNLVGFEHAPRDERQRAALAKMADDLKAAERLFKLPAGAQCTAGPVTITHPYQAAPASGGPARAPSGEHAELQALWSFACAKPAAIDRVEVQLFDTFRGLKRIKTQTVSPRGQGAATLTPGKRSVPL